MGAGCPPQGNAQCSEDAPGCGETSELTVAVLGGLPYLVRVGGADGGGVGVLTVTCVPFP